MIYTLMISLLIEKLFYLLRPQSFSFQIVSEFIDKFVKFSNCMRLLTPRFVPRGGVLYKMIVFGFLGFFTPFESCPRGVVLDEIDTCIRRLKCEKKFQNLDSRKSALL